KPAGEYQRGFAKKRIAIAMANAASRSDREFNYVRNSCADRAKSAATRNAFLHAALLGNRRCFNCSRHRAKVLAGVAEMDAAHVADFYSCHLVTRRLGRDNSRLAFASTAVFSRTSSGVTQSDQRPRTLAR